jgi:hypothetical protein
VIKGSERVPDSALISASALRGGGRGIGRKDKDGIVMERRGVGDVGSKSERSLDLCLKRAGMTGTSGSEARRMAERGEGLVMAEERLDEVVDVVIVRSLRVLRVDEVRKGPLYEEWKVGGWDNSPGALVLMRTEGVE